MRREHRTSLANLGCGMPGPMSVSAMLTMTPGCSPLRLRSALAVRGLVSRTVGACPVYGHAK